MGQHDAYEELIDLETMGTLIGRLRRRRRLTQAKLAERMGMHPSFISHLERGYKYPSIATFVPIAKGLELHPNQFFVLALREEPTGDENFDRRFKELRESLLDTIFRQSTLQPKSKTVR